MDPKGKGTFYFLSLDFVKYVFYIIINQIIIINYILGKPGIKKYYLIFSPTMASPVTRYLPRANFTDTGFNNLISDTMFKINNNIGRIR